MTYHRGTNETTHAEVSAFRQEGCTCEPIVELIEDGPAHWRVVVQHELICLILSPTPTDPFA